MQTLDDMRRLQLLTVEQRERIGEWVARHKTPEAIMAMPADLWRALTLASVLMNVDAELLRPPPLGDEAAAP